MFPIIFVSRNKRHTFFFLFFHKYYIHCNIIKYWIILITGAAGLSDFLVFQNIYYLNKNYRIYGVDVLNSYYSLKLKKKG